MKGVLHLAVLLAFAVLAAWTECTLAADTVTPSATGAGSAAAASGAKAEPAPAWAFDPPHCSVMFFVKHILAKVPGRFGVYSGTVRFDPANLGGSSST